MEAWQQKIVDEGVDYIKNKLPVDQAELEKLVANGPPATLTLSMATFAGALARHSTYHTVLGRMVVVLQQHVHRADTSQMQLIDAATNALNACSIVSLSYEDTKFACAQAKGKLAPDMAHAMESLYVLRWHLKLETLLTFTISLRHFFTLHLTDLIPTGTRKKSVIHS
jgi:hypothetical protein